MRINRGIAVAVAAACGVIALVAAIIVVAVPDRAGWRGPTGDAVPAPVEEPCGGWDCGLQAHFAATQALVEQAPGHLGLVVRDRTTGQIWQSGAATRPIWTASTIKLAIITDLLVRARAGSVIITASMRTGFDDMLASSANRPATNLWPTHGGEAALERYRTVFGMAGVHFPTSERLWGAVKATAVDFSALMSYVLDALSPEDRAYVTDAMRTVDEVQQWGVWAAGPDQEPGVKAGWNAEQTPEGQSHWVVNSVGFAGSDARYVVAVMYELLPGTRTRGHGLEDGLHVVSDVVATLFGATVPATIPDPDLLLNPPT
jgi:hypothetical protein